MIYTKYESSGPFTSGDLSRLGNQGIPHFTFPIGKKCQNLSRSENKMIDFYMPQHIARRINTNQRIAKTNALAKSEMKYLGFHLLDILKNV